MINSKIYVVTNIDSDEEQIHALFSQPEYAETFIKRSPAIENNYKILSFAIDQDFTSSPTKNPYGVILDPENEDYYNVHSCTDQNEEAQAAKTSVSKLDDHFYMMLYAVDEIEAEQVARKHLKDLLENGKWVDLKDADDDWV
jgi:hypothetical protein